MPYLDEWSTLEEDYSNSLSGTSNALLSSSVRLPVSGEVRVRFLLPTLSCVVNSFYGLTMDKFQYLVLFVMN